MNFVLRDFAWFQEKILSLAVQKDGEPEDSFTSVNPRLVCQDRLLHSRSFWEDRPLTRDLD